MQQPNYTSEGPNLAGRAEKSKKGETLKEIKATVDKCFFSGRTMRHFIWGMTTRGEESFLMVRNRDSKLGAIGIGGDHEIFVPGACHAAV